MQTEKLHREVLEAKLNMHGRTSITVGITQNALGSILRKKGKLDEAVPFLEAALKVREATRGEETDAAITRDELACCLQAQGRREEARAMRLRGGQAALICSNEPCSQTARAAGVSKLRMCSRCNAIWYCSAACQRADWKQQHKAVCKPKEDGAATAAAAAAAKE